MPKPPTEQQRKNMNWFIPLFMGLVAIGLIFWAWSDSPTHRHYNPANPESAQHTYQDSPAISKLPPNVNPKTKTQEEYTEQGKESYVASRSDLAAQWAMAHYTFVGLVMGVIGICFIIWTLIETRGAALFAEKTLAETKDSSRKELRSYIHVVPYALNLNSTEDTPTVILRIFNKGQTPALNISCDISAEEDGKEMASDAFPCKVSIPPNSHEDIIWPLEDADMTTTWAVKIYFLTKYNDIFGFDRFVNIGLDVFDSSFPNSKPVLFQTNWITGEGSTGRRHSNPQDIPFENPDFEREVIIPFVSYGDDLQKEAKEYKQANQA